MTAAFTGELDVVLGRSDRGLRIERRPVAVTEAGARVGEAFFATAQIASVSFHPGAGRRPSARCSDRRGARLFEVVFDGLGDAHRFLAALGRDPAECRQEFAVAGPTAASGARILLGATFAVALAVATELAVAATRLGAVGTAFVTIGVLATTMLALLWPARLLVGADGILWSWYHRRRFVPWSDVVARGGEDSPFTESRSPDVVVRIRRGRPLVLTQAFSASRIEQETMRTRIDLLWRAHAVHADDAVIDRLVRGARPLGTWRAALTRMRGDESYREMAVSEEQLWHIVEDAGAPEDARAGAAVALRGAEEAAPRLRVAAVAVASPHLRVALEAASDPEVDESTLDEALARITR